VYLRPIAALLISEPERGPQIERILQRCGQDGIDAVVDQYITASSLTVRRLYREVLFRMPGVIEALVQMLGDPRWHVVRQAAEFLGDLGAQDAEHALADQLRHQDTRVRRAVTRALARSDSVFSLDAMSRAIVDDAPAVRLEAVSALAARKGARATALLSQAIDDEGNQEVQYAILGGLGRLASPDAVQKLAKAAEAASGFFKSKKNSGLRAAAVQALAEARTPAALQALQGLAADKDREVRDAVTRALQSSRSSAA
jgi:HEAT repeat protein